jgi:hypothetical protein
MFGHSALKPKEVGLVRLQPLLVWSEDLELKKEVEDFLNAEFDDYINIISLDSLDHTSLKLRVVEDLKEINIHILEIKPKSAKLTFRTGKVIEEEFDDLEELLEKIGRELIAYYHKSIN